MPFFSADVMSFFTAGKVQMLIMTLTTIRSMSLHNARREIMFLTLSECGRTADFTN